MTQRQKYLFVLGLLISTSLLCVGLTSYHFDPANIYHAHAGDDANNSATAFAAKLLRSKNGLLWPNDSWNERDVKSTLAQSDVNVDCVVIGSSHAMQIGSFRKNASLTRSCVSILNLGVSGGTLEDYLAMSLMLLNRKQKPKSIIFCVDPWALDFRRDSRWERYEDSYLLMKRMLQSGEMGSTRYGDSGEQYLLNLINPSYFIRSIKKAGRRKHEIIQAPAFKYSEGISDPVFLPDGSLVYSKKYIFDADSLKIPVGGGSYKTKHGSQISEKAINTFEKLVVRLNEEGINSIIVMTPYHHRVWMDNKSITARALKEVEPRIRELGRKLNIKVLGSYNPDAVGCSPDEFYDFMHPKYSCVAKIDH